MRIGTICLLERLVNEGDEVGGLSFGEITGDVGSVSGNSGANNRRYLDFPINQNGDSFVDVMSLNFLAPAGLKTNSTMGVRETGSLERTAELRAVSSSNAVLESCKVSVV